MLFFDVSKEIHLILQRIWQKKSLVVDELKGEFQNKIKTFGSPLKQISGIDGSTILGLRDIALILNVRILVALTTAAEPYRSNRRSLIV